MPMELRNAKVLPTEDIMSDDTSEPEYYDQAEPRAMSAPAPVPAGAPGGAGGASTSATTETVLAGFMESFVRMQAETNRTLVETLRAFSDCSRNPPTSTPTPDIRPPSAYSSAVTGNFAKCTARFDGRSRDAEVLEAFIDAVQVYKECAGVSDEHALRGLPILLEGDAAVWWRGARASVHTWPDAVARLRAMYGMQQPPYKVLREIVNTEQKDSERAEVFVCKVRSMFAKLPYAVPMCMQLDLIYGLLHRRVRKRLPRGDVNDIDIVIEKVRAIEDSIVELNLSTYAANPIISTTKSASQNLSRSSHAAPRDRGHQLESESLSSD
ncbi:activity-regulated cytoskeleton associated protein 2-like, partial [Ostrinia furnacalis]|uniref:activity-regulated cytoskeleton associated protein 2-like n=1 Tax=Ostrinia furnacalis TaxID=93504 RepID=UPI00103D4C0A